MVSRDLVSSFNTAYREEKLSLSQRRGVITLIPKEDSRLSSLSNRRPITLFKFRLQDHIQGNSEENRKSSATNNPLGPNWFCERKMHWPKYSNFQISLEYYCFSIFRKRLLLLNGPLFRIP